jgi:hypothetical protein
MNNNPCGAGPLEQPVRQDINDPAYLFRQCQKFQEANYKLQAEILMLRTAIKSAAYDLDIMCRRGTAKDPGVLAVVMDLRKAVSPNYVLDT